MTTIDLTPLQLRVARDIVSYARRENLKAGQRMVESLLAEQVGTSRSPVNAALCYLGGLGVLAHDLNRGYVLECDAAKLHDIAQRIENEIEDPLYLRIAADRLDRRLDDVVTETHLVRTYATTRGTVRRVLSRIQQEGWIEKASGQGWTFQPMIDSVEAYDESYVFRTALEPTALTTAGFNADLVEFSALRRQQEFIAKDGYQSMTEIELFESNSDFHGTLAKWSGNRFILQSVRRIDQLRRLVEYRQSRDRAPRRVAALEHILVLDAIADNDLFKAATLLRAHLDRARREKVFGAATPRQH